jgi:hypothetical protein
MSKSRKSFYILIPLIACVFAVLLLEFGLALFYPIPFSLEKNMYYETDPHTGFRHKPLGSGHYPNGVEAVANSRGQRDGEVAVPKPEGVFRILLIGDSFTVGANVEQHEVYGQVLEDLLNDAVEQPIEVVNAGTGGWNPFQYAQFYEHYGQAFQPDLVVVGFFVGNDTYIDATRVEDTRSAVLGRRLPRDAGQGRGIQSLIFLYEHSHIARALLRSGPTELSFTREQCDNFTELYIAVQKNRIYNHLAEASAEDSEFIVANADQMQRIKSLAAESGAPLLTVILPDENQLNPDLQAQVIPAAEASAYNFDMPQAALHELFAERGIQYVDLLDNFRADERCLYMNDTHWVPAGHRFVAERIRDYLLTSQLLN